jgi:hypothetical protein
MEEVRNMNKILVVKPEGKRPLGNPSVNGSGSGPLAESCENDNEPSCSIKGEEFLDYLGDYQLCTKDSFPWS